MKDESEKINFFSLFFIFKTVQSLFLHYRYYHQSLKIKFNIAKTHNR